MITLKYRPISDSILGMDEVYMLCDVTLGDSDKVRLDILSKVGDKAIVAGRRYRLKDSGCEIDFDKIPDGVVEVSIISDGEKIPATPFLKTDGTILRLPIDSPACDMIKNALLELTDKVSALEERVSAIEDKINPKPFFKFK